MKIEADIDELIQLVSTSIETHTTAFLLADNQKRVLRLLSFYSLSDNIASDVSIPFGYGPIGWVAENLAPFDLSKFSDRDSGLLKLYSKNEEIKSFAAVPVLRGQMLIGVLCVDSKRSFVFTPKEQKLLTIFAGLFADFVNNIRLRELINTDVSGIAFLYDFCKDVASATKVEHILQLTLDSVIDMLKCDDCLISLRLDEDRNYFRIEAVHNNRNLRGTIFSEQDSLAGCVISSGEPFLLTNRRRDSGSVLFTSSKPVSRFSSFLGVPLFIQNKVLGLICVIDNRKNYFNQRDLQVVSIMGDNIAIAISSIRAQEKIELWKNSELRKSSQAF